MTFDVKDAVIETFAGKNVGNNYSTEIDEETLLFSGGLGISSLKLLQGLVKLEEKFNIVFDDRSVAESEFHTIGEVINFVEQLLEEAL